MLAAVLIAAAGARAQEGGTTAVDLPTYIGWRVFSTHCASCHGLGGEGTTFAPALAPRIERLDFRRFSDLLDDGYPGVNSLPPWGERPDVRRYYAELWAYLEGRADGSVPGNPLRQREN